MEAQHYTYERKTDKLKCLFKILDRKFFKSQLTNVEVMLKANGILNRKTPYSENCGDGFVLIVPLILLCCEPCDIANFFLHEMIHLYGDMKGLPVSSKKGIYHNSTFKEFANVVGLTCEYTVSGGWGDTSLQSNKKLEMEKIINDLELQISEEEYRYRLQEFEERNNSKFRLTPYICPICNTTVYTSRAVNLICESCNTPFEPKKST